ncbi:MAG: peptide chain release factor 2 [Phycisphaerae bacterium]
MPTAAEGPSATELAARIHTIRDTLDLPTKQARLAALESRMSAPDFWNDQESAQRVVKELKALKGLIDPVEQTRRRIEDLHVLYELAREANDPATLAEAEAERAALADQIEQVSLMALLSGPDDARDCYFAIQAGAGGTEACDWAEMLFRMYLRYFEKRGWAVEELDRKNGEEAGIQSVNLQVSGPYAYGYLACEMGVHRLVRISPFNAQGKRQTSFAAVDVLPVFEDKKIEIADADVEIVFFRRSSGAGGQNVNKLSTAVRVKHLPTGLVVECVNERSQQQNKRVALSVLQSKLEQMEQAKRDAELAKIYGSKGEIAWGNQIRNYVLDDPRVKDLRNGVEVGNPQRVLDGDIQQFIDAELRRRAVSRTKKGA